MINHAQYTSAGSIPIKLICCHDAIQNGLPIPYHLQLYPTNRCNKNCPFCSCALIDRSEELLYEEIHDMLPYFRRLGSRSITICGGGEPTLHPQLNRLLLEMNEHNYDIGLVTNGIIWYKENNFEIQNKTLTWVRLSLTRDHINKIWIAAKIPQVDVGVSYTIYGNINETIDFKQIIEMCKIAEQLPNLTHIRFVTDINNENLNESMNQIRVITKKVTTKGIYQSRDEFTRGTKDCWLSLLKPVIAADGYIYPCCGVQYAIDKSLTLPEQFRMGKWYDYHKFKPFDGSICNKCYYNNYNEILRILTTSKHRHDNFI